MTPHVYKLYIESSKAFCGSLPTIILKSNMHLGLVHSIYTIFCIEIAYNEVGFGSSLNESPIFRGD